MEKRGIVETDGTEQRRPRKEQRRKSGFERICRLSDAARSQLLYSSRDGGLLCPVLKEFQVLASN